MPKLNPGINEMSKNKVLFRKNFLRRQGGSASAVNPIGNKLTAHTWNSPLPCAKESVKLGSQEENLLKLSPSEMKDEPGCEEGKI